MLFRSVVVVVVVVVGGDDSSIDGCDVGDKGEESNGCGNGPSTEGEDGGDKGMDGAKEKRARSDDDDDVGCYVCC